MKQEAPATLRNRAPILAVLQDILPTEGTVLEIAAGTGEHAAHFAPNFPGLTWQPSDPDDGALASIAAWGAEVQADNLQKPIRLDVLERPWPITAASALICINMIHISPWACTEALMTGAGDILKDEGVLYLYGPYKIDGAHTAPSNIDFDGWLKNKDPSYGVRDLEQVIEEAAKNGLNHLETRSMPANNFSVIFRKA